MSREDGEVRKARPASRQTTARSKLRVWRCASRESDELNNFHSCKRREAAYDGKRTNKYTDITETLYFNSFWSYYIDGSTRSRGGAVSKHIYLGETRLATVINDYRNVEDKTFGTEKNHIYFYHSDHLGSAQLVTDHNGDEYQRLEYTPYGETWVDIKKIAVEQVPMNFMFSAKELDKETGFYYYGARYLDPKYSRWISADPAMNTGEYFPVAPVDDEAKKHNGNLPGMGGIFNHINGNLYHYAANNPIKYTDPDGRTTYIDEKTGEIISYVNDGDRSVFSGAIVNGNIAMESIKKVGYTTRADYALSPTQPYNKTDKDLVSEKTSGYLFLLYRNDQGKNYTLRELGLLDKIKTAVATDQRITGNKGTVLERFINQIKNGDKDDFYFRSSYDFTMVKFGIGGAQLGGILDGIVYKTSEGKTHIEGTITFYFEDTFTDPYDLLDIIPGEINIDGKPYKIKDTWTIDINGDF